MSSEPEARWHGLTRLQSLYWAGQQLRPDAPLFSAALTFTSRTRVDAAHLTRAWQATVRQTDILQTVMTERAGTPQQRWDPDRTGHLEVVDLSGEAAPDAALEAWLTRATATTLCLRQRPYHAALIHVHHDRHVVFLNLHHAITDAAASCLLFERLSRLYARSLRGQDLTADVGTPFAEYVAHEHARRHSDRADVSRAFWARKLTPGPEPRAAKDPGGSQSTRVRRHSLELDSVRSCDLRALAREPRVFSVSDEVTLYCLLASAFFAYLSRATGRRRLGVIAPVHNRFAARFAHTIGPVMELCPLQMEVDPTDTYLALVDKMKREIRDTLPHTQGASGLSLRGDQFDVMFNLHVLPQCVLAGEPVTVRQHHPGHGNERLALHVHHDLGTERLHVHLDVREDAQEAGGGEQILTRYLEILDEMLRNVSAVPTGRPHLASAPTAERRRPRTGPDAPRDVLELKLAEIWRRLLGLDAVGLHDRFFDLGGNSWLALRLVREIHELTGQYLPLTTLLRAPTIATLARGLREELGETRWSTLITIREGRGGPTLYCVPGAGGNGLAVARIARHLSDDTTVRMFQIPLLDDAGAPRFERIEDMAAHYVQALRRTDPDGPYFLAGYSAGGLVAFEAAQQLLASGRQVAFLAIIDVPAQGPVFRHLRWTTRSVQALLRRSPEWERETYLRHRDRLFRTQYFVRRGWVESLRSTVGSLGRRAGAATRPTPEASVEHGDQAWQQEDAIMRRYFEINSVAVKTYVPQSYPGRLVLIRSSQGYEYPEQRSPDRLLGWGRVAQRGVEDYEVPGNHMAIVREPSVSVLGHVLGHCLSRTRETHSAEPSVTQVQGEAPSSC